MASFYSFGENPASIHICTDRLINIQPRTHSLGETYNEKDTQTHTSALRVNSQPCSRTLSLSHADVCTHAKCSLLIFTHVSPASKSFIHLLRVCACADISVHANA